MLRNSTTTLSTTSLLPFTRLVLVVSAVVQLVFGLVGLFFTTQLWNTVFWTAPLPAWPVEAMRFASLTSVATALAALYALSQGSWDGARVSFAFSFPYIVLLHRALGARGAGDGHLAGGAADHVAVCAPLDPLSASGGVRMVSSIAAGARGVTRGVRGDAPRRGCVRKPTYGLPKRVQT
jgi:hypothetical protein